MSLLARLFNLQNGQTADATQVNADFNQILNALNATSTDKNLSVRYNHATEAPVTEDQLGAGLLALWRQGGVDKAKVNNDGSFETVRQFKSTVVTGTAPLVVASTTLVANLNSDKVDGLDGTQFLRNDAAGALSASDATSLFDINQTGAGAITRFRLSGVDKVVIANSGQLIVPDLKITGAAPLLTFEDTTGGAADWTWDLNGDIFTGTFVGDPAFLNFNRSNGLTAIAGGLVVGGDLDVQGNIFRTWKHLVADTATNAATNADMKTFTVAAGTLPTDGSRIRFHAAGTGLNNGETVTVSFNGTTVGQIALGDTATVVWQMEITIIRLSATSVRCVSHSSREHVNYNDGAVAETRTFNVDVTVNNLGSSTNSLNCFASGTITQNWLGGEFMRI